MPHLNCPTLFSEGRGTMLQHDQPSVKKMLNVSLEDE